MSFYMNKWHQLELPESFPRETIVSGPIAKPPTVMGQPVGGEEVGDGEQRQGNLEVPVITGTMR